MDKKKHELLPRHGGELCATYCEKPHYFATLLDCTLPAASKASLSSTPRLSSEASVKWRRDWTPVAPQEGRRFAHASQQQRPQLLIDPGIGLHGFVCSQSRFYLLDGPLHQRLAA